MIAIYLSYVPPQGCLKFTREIEKFAKEEKEQGTKLEQETKKVKRS